MLSSVLYTRESLLFCEKALYGEVETLRKEGTVKEAIKFTDVCPEVRQRAENNLNRWLEIVLALLAPITRHPPDNP
jgi:hypothetical protein